MRAKPPDLTALPTAIAGSTVQSKGTAQPKLGIIDMDRKRLARLAYNTAIDRVARDTSLTTAEKRQRNFRISNAYEARKSQLDLAAFLKSHRLDRYLSNLVREHAEGRVGDVPVALGVDLERDAMKVRAA